MVNFVAASLTKRIFRSPVNQRATNLADFVAASLTKRIFRSPVNQRATDFGKFVADSLTEWFAGGRLDGARAA